MKKLRPQNRTWHTVSMGFSDWALAIFQRDTTQIALQIEEN